jgi:hypothetical protein
MVFERSVRATSLAVNVSSPYSRSASLVVFAMSDGWPALLLTAVPNIFPPSSGPGQNE